MNKRRRYQNKRIRARRKMLADINNGMHSPSLDVLLAMDMADAAWRGWGNDTTPTESKQP